MNRSSIFTIGDEPYKLTFGAEPMPMWQVTRAGSPLGYLAGALVEKLPAAKALARNIFRRGTDKRPAPAHNAAPPLTDEGSRSEGFPPIVRLKRAACGCARRGPGSGGRRCGVEHATPQELHLPAAAPGETVVDGKAAAVIRQPQGMCIRRLLLGGSS